MYSQSHNLPSTLISCTLSKIIPTCVHGNSIHHCYGIGPTQEHENIAQALEFGYHGNNGECVELHDDCGSMVPGSGGTQICDIRKFRRRESRVHLNSVKALPVTLFRVVFRIYACASNTILQRWSTFSLP